MSLYFVCSSCSLLTFIAWISHYFVLNFNISSNCLLQLQPTHLNIMDISLLHVTFNMSLYFVCSSCSLLTLIAWISHNFMLDFNISSVCLLQLQPTHINSVDISLLSMSLYFVYSSLQPTQIESKMYLAPSCSLLTCLFNLSPLAAINSH